jgi:hypothetical protein
MPDPPSSPPSVPTKIVPASTHIRRQSTRHSIDFSPPSQPLHYKQPHLSPSRTTHALPKPYFSATHYSILRSFCSSSTISRGDTEAWKKLLSKEKLPVPYTAYVLFSHLPAVHLIQQNSTILICIFIDRQDAYDLEMTTVGLAIELGM